MYRVESLKLFGDISKVSDKYKSWHLKDDENEIKDNRKLKTLLNYHNSRFDHIKEKYDFLSYQTKNELKNKSKYELHKILNEFNNISYKKFSSLKNSNIDSTTVKAVMFATIDELYLINESIRKRDYLENKNLYFPHSLPHLFLFYQIFPHLTSVCGWIIIYNQKDSEIHLSLRLIY